MRRRARILLNAATALSLVLCLATVALWVRGVWVNDIVARYGPSGGWDVQSWHGRLVIHTSDEPGDSPPTTTTRRTSWWPRPVTSADSDSPAFRKKWWNRAGFLYVGQAFPPRRGDGDWPRRTPLPAIRHHGYARVPLWSVSLVGAVLPALRWTGLLRWRQRHRSAHGLCPACGYDLRATPDRCPECGTVPVRAGG